MGPASTPQTVVIRGGRVVDPSQKLDEVTDITLRDGRIASIGPAHSAGDATVDAAGLIVCPGLIDIHVHLREPGGEAAETIESGTRAAAAGGFTAVACMPNTQPPIADVDTIRFVLDKAARVGSCRVHPVAAMTVGRQGRTPVDMAAFMAAGAVAFSDDGAGLDADKVARAVFEQAAACGALLMQHCEVAALAGDGCVNAGPVADALGLPGIDPAAEEQMIARDLDLLRRFPARYHVSHISTAGAVEQVRRAKAAGLPVTAEVTIHHLTLTQEAVLRLGPNAKMKPPLRTAADVEACRQGLVDGTIDCIATDHAPHSFEAKARGLKEAPFGIIGLESAWPLANKVLVESRRCELTRLIDLMSCTPARILGRVSQGTLAPGSEADVSLIDPGHSWVFDGTSIQSGSTNSPFLGLDFIGRSMLTFVGGGCAFRHADMVSRLSGLS
ncbi:MAG: dihydroorotase [Phycisphaerae bacterium]|nr:dihydroorotase [Phycisphaerae bacterium]